MLIIVEQVFTDGCTFSFDHSTPMEYESLEAAMVDFESANEKFQWEGNFVFGGSKFSTHDPRYGDASFYTLDEWIKYHKAP